jgi:hypothetical protein
VKGAVHAIRKELAPFDWIGLTPDHFLHVWVGRALDLDAATAEHSWREIAPFTIAYRGVNCFHDAVIVEAHTDGVAEFAERALPHVDLEYLLPHMSVGYFRRRERPAALRAALKPLHDLNLGVATVDEALLCDIPIAKSTFLEPWRVIASVPLKR